jgi:retron-type reverse transcriptase
LKNERKVHIRNDSKIYALNQSPFYKLRNRKRLSELLGITPADLQYLSKQANELYREFPIQKKSGGTRDVENPARKLKLLQAKLARWLGRITPPDYLFCPVKGRCYVGNAAQHRGQRIVHCLDIRKYFPSTSSRRVFWFFHKIMKCERDIAAILTRLSTYKGYLPTGSPLSPILSYFAHFDVWEAIAKICGENGYRLTVYIDDVTISGTNLSAKIIWNIKTLIHRSGLRYHKEKSYFDCPAEITGVIVHGYRLLPPNRQMKKLRAAEKLLRETKWEFEASRIREKINGLQGQMAQIAAQSRLNEQPTLKSSPG